MDITSLIAIAIALSFDSFAASLTCGAVKNHIAFGAAMRVAAFMALFQGCFTIIGYFAGSVISTKFSLIDHWIAFGILGFLGLRMIINGMKKEDNYPFCDITSLPNILALATGTSVDALAAGVSFAVLSMNIWVAGVVIGIVTFIASMTAIRIGKSVGKKTGSKVEIAGGVILIVIGIRILYEHLVA